MGIEIMNCSNGLLLCQGISVYVDGRVATRLKSNIEFAIAAPTSDFRSIGLEVMFNKHISSIVYLSAYLFSESCSLRS